MQNFELLGKELERRGKTEAVKQLADSPEGQKLAGMLDTHEIEQAARSGDGEALRRMLSQVLTTPEGQKLAENVRRMMEK